MRAHRMLIVASLLAFTACDAPLEAAANGVGPAGSDAAPRDASRPFTITELGRFDEPWAMAFLPDGRLLVSEKRGRLKLRAVDGKVGEIGGVPAVAYGGQGGFGDVVPHPRFADNGQVYLSYAESGEGGVRGAAVARARLVLDDAGGGQLSDLQVIWRQSPKVDGQGHYGHRIAFGPDGKLWITSGDRQQMEPAQDLAGNLGKVIRLETDGGIPADNPYVERGGVTAQVWSLGHRNPLGIAFDAGGRPWVGEMGPRGGDELNLVERGRNYGWPLVSEGRHYDGRSIAAHATSPRFVPPEVSWTPVIAPAGMIIYSGSAFPDWRGDVLLAGLVAQALVRVEVDGDSAREAARYDLGERIREVEQAPDGRIWVLEDGADARLLALAPAG